MLEVLAGKLSKRKKQMEFRSERKSKTIFTDDMILYTENKKKASVQAKTCSQIFIAALLTVAGRWK